MNKIIHKRNKMNILLNRILSFTIVFIMVSTICFAGNSRSYTVDEIVNDINTGDGPYATIQQILGILSWAGFAIAILKLVQIGMLFMMSGAKKRNDAKAALFPWAIGAAVCLLFGTVGPWFIKLLMGDGSTGVFDI